MKSKSKLKHRRLTALALSVTLSLGTVTQAWAAGAAPAPNVLGTVKLAGTSYFELNDVRVIASDNGKFATFTITVHNAGTTDLKLVDYWIRLQSKSGQRFTTKLLPADKDKMRIAPGSRTELTYYANVNETTKLHDLLVQFIQWDFTQPNFERKLGEVAVPAHYNGVYASDAAAPVAAGGNELHASISRYVSNKNEKYHVPSLYVKLENNGQHAVKVPAYIFYIRTQDDLLYPLEVKGLKELEIKPKETKELTLSGTIPVEVAPGGWELLITESVPDLKRNVELAAFALPAEFQGTEGSLGKPYTFKAKDGVYTAALQSVQRLPWDNHDVLAADLTLRNTGNKSLPIPKLKGYFMLDDAVKIEATLVKPSAVVGLAAGEETKLQLAGKVPYTSQFKSIKLVLQEQESDTAVTDVLEFTTLADVQPIPTLPAFEAHEVQDIGRRASYKIRAANQYNGNTGSVFNAEVEVANLEKRIAPVSKLVAHYRTPDGTVLPASVMEVANKISPSNTALLHVWAHVPQGISTDNLQLIVGEAVSSGQLSEGTAIPDSYVNPVAFSLPAEKQDVKSGLKNVQAYPYTVSFSRISTTVENSTLTLKFDYDITRTPFVTTNMDGHKLVLVFKDSSGEQSFEKSFDMKDIDPAAGDTADAPLSKLKLGKHSHFKIQVTDPDLIYKSSYLNKFKLSLYEEFQGGRKLLAEQDVSWFTTTD
ncbi:hypothetical protein [Paenibacillus sp. YYML68]|uniref:hypothetical protein n=1 Tax=Paenibacillus sp. YYML68 TaxID=2909250 RepID=UPI002491AF36|nr:hypothetical protein [Paenibacillus sp. YYML68]